MGLNRFFFLFIFLGFYFRVQWVVSQEKTCNPSDLKALRNFLSEKIHGWDNSSDCCSWVGVKCNDRVSGERVVRLDLSSKRLNGVNFGFFSGLNQLTFLNLSNNLIRSIVPSDLFLLQQLETLDLSNNRFYGQIPADTYLPSLKVFNVSYNSFEGNKPMLNGSQNLELFDISFNNFSGLMPITICDVWKRIRILRLSANYFSGNIPSGFGNCSSLIELYLDSNSLIGNFPDEVFHLSELKILNVQDNNLSGILSDKVGNLSSLTHFDISVNSFFGIFPEIFDDLINLQQFSADSNNFWGTLPSSLYNSSSLNLLNFRNNSLSGVINLNCMSLKHLHTLNLGSNQFQGNIPSNFSYCKELRTINLARNMLHGKIPESFKDIPALSYLSLTNNSFYDISSALNILQNCRNLSVLVLTKNFHGEMLPFDEIRGFHALKVLVIPYCGLLGSIPPWLRSLNKLELLDLSWNKLSGSIPSWIEDLNFLFYLDLSNNSLSGEIPQSLTRLKRLISGKTTSENSPSPTFRLLSRVNQSSSGVQYNQVSGFRPSILLSYNNLSGKIWPEFGNLKRLHVLDLKYNKLSGIIPSELSGMTNLEILDISNNNISGTIPNSLTNLTFLSFFNVANNNLFGPIPTGRQFRTFLTSSFEGNPGLCGEPLSPCWRTNSSRSESIKKRNMGIIVGIPLGIGSVTSLLLILILFVFLRFRRIENIDPEKEKDKHHSSSGSVIVFQNKDFEELTIGDLLNSTNNFDQANIIGCGGFGLVYKAILPNGKKVAIKQLSGDFGQMKREFQAEVEILSKAKHENLVLLQGYCWYGEDRLLIYSYMENGSLDYWLHEKTNGRLTLDWTRRLRIAQGVARGLEYLHQSCEPHILHRDIKSSNILLDENFDSHLADFGLARLIEPYDTHVTTDLVGTLGYIPPEYSQSSMATFKGDVYSFGVVLLELLAGRRPMDISKPSWCRDLVSWMLEMKAERREETVFDPLIYNKLNHKPMARMLEISCLCLNKYPKERPWIQEIVQWLDKIEPSIPFSSSSIEEQQY